MSSVYSFNKSSSSMTNFREQKILKGNCVCVCHVQPQEDRSAFVALKREATLVIVRKTPYLIMEQF
jgi:hypothetical protein